MLSSDIARAAYLLKVHGITAMEKTEPPELAKQLWARLNSKVPDLDMIKNTIDQEYTMYYADLVNHFFFKNYDAAKLLVQRAKHFTVLMYLTTKKIAEREKLTPASGKMKTQSKRHFSTRTNDTPNRPEGKKYTKDAEEIAQKYIWKNGDLHELTPFSLFKVPKVFTMTEDDYNTLEWKFRDYLTHFNPGNYAF